MPKVNPDDYQDWDDEDLNIEEDDQLDKGGKIVHKPYRPDPEWEEQRKIIPRKRSPNWD